MEISSENVSGILIVDDSEINREICAMNLEHLNIPLFFAEDGEIGLRIAEEKNPDLILLDIMMPNMDGLTMLDKLKQNEKLAHTPVLMLSARGEIDSIVMALNAGANDYLKKPFAEEEMVARVNTLLRNRYLELRLAEDLAAGAKMQQKFLTDSHKAEAVLRDCNVRISIYNKPYSSISGDFYHACNQAPGTGSFLLGDSCGHGLSAALISMRVIGYMQQLAVSGQGLNTILQMLNEDISGTLPFGTFVAASLYRFEQDTVLFANGGQPYPVHISHSGIEEIENNGPPLGLKLSTSYTEQTIRFSPGDRLLIYTDGAVEAMDENGLPYGKRRLYHYLKHNWAGYSGSSLLTGLIQDLELYCGTTLFEDDISLILFERLSSNEDVSLPEKS